MMTFEELKPKIFAKIKKAPNDLGAYKDCLDVCINFSQEFPKMAHETNREMRNLLGQNMKNIPDIKEAFELYRKSLLWDAPVDFDAYMLYLEIERPAKERFYAPRRKILRKLVQGMQMLADDELDELFLSMPPRVGKTTILLFYVTWILGRHPERSNLYSAFSDIITKAFYNGVLEVLNDPSTYRWNDVFPDCHISSTNSQDETVNVNRKKRYPSITCRSLYGTLNGACDCDGIEISDDLIGGIEEALNNDRLRAAWEKVDNNLLPRAKEKAKILWCGTRWSIMDPAGVRMELLQNDERFKNRRYMIINLPALDENDESNFDYDYGVGFSTDYYHQRRASFERNNDMASWSAQYMCEPIERDGALFSPQDLRYYNGELPEGTPDRIFMAVDPAWGGGDFVAAPICYQYGMDIYVHDVVFDNSDKSITQPKVAKKIMEHKVAACQIESTKATEAYKETVQDILKSNGYRCNMTSKPAPTNVGKEQRIFDKSPDIREMMVFRESGKRSKEYELFLQNVMSFKITGKNKHDDAPDSLSMAIDMVVHPMGKVQLFRRTF